MCVGGAERRAHHAAEEQKREMAAQVARQEEMYRDEMAMMRQQAEQNRPVPPPVPVDSTQNPARVTSKRSKRGAQRMGALGAAGLRIPTTGVSMGGGAGMPSSAAGSSVKLNIG
jgi:hypothetical protein